MQVHTLFDRALFSVFIFFHRRWFWQKTPTKLELSIANVLHARVMFILFRGTLWKANSITEAVLSKNLVYIN